MTLDLVSHPSSQLGDARVARTKRDVHNRSEKQTNRQTKNAAFSGAWRPPSVRRKTPTQKTTQKKTRHLAAL